MWRLCICWLNCICFTLITAWNNYKPPHWNILKENLPNLSVVGTEGNKQFEVQWNDRESKVSMNLMKETYTHLFCASCPWFILTALLTVASLGTLSFLAKQVFWIFWCIKIDIWFFFFFLSHWCISQECLIGGSENKLSRCSTRW